MDKLININEQDLAEHILLGGSQRERALRTIYLDKDLAISVSKLASKYGVQEIEMQDIFQESMIILDQNIRRGKFEGKSNIKTYLLSIIKYSIFSWLRSKKKQRHVDIDSIIDLEAVESHWKKKEQREKLVQQLLAQTDQKCRKLLVLFMTQTPMKEIAETLAFTKVQSAKNAVHRCREKLKKWVKANHTFNL